MKNIYIELLKEIKKKKACALATIIETKGSAPQIPGASAIFTSSGLLMGTLGGGILEANAQKKALSALETGHSIIVEFDLTSDSFTEDKAICGGEAKILIDPEPERHIEAFQSLHDSQKNHQPGVLATTISLTPKGSTRISRTWMDEQTLSDSESRLHRVISREGIQKSLSQNRPVLLRNRENWLFLEPVLPHSQLVIAGAGHIGQAVAHLGSLLNFEVTVIDDRVEYANAGKLPDADHLVVGDIGTALERFTITPDTYIVIVTRGHRHDTDVLKSCISSPASYIGMIGSRRKIDLIREKFLIEGWATTEEFDRVYAPIGLDIHSKTVEEIAVSIAAQLVLVRSQSHQ